MSKTPDAAFTPFAWTVPPIEETTTIAIKDLVLDAGTQGRATLSEDKIIEYAEIIKESVKHEQPNPFELLGEDFLPAAFRDATGRTVLAGGFHRVAAYKRAGVKEITVAIRTGTDRDAFLYSLQDNSAHGIQRTNKDKLRALKLVLADEELAALNLPNTEIARIIATSVSFVQAHRKLAASPTKRKVTRGGKTFEVDTSGIGKKGGAKKPKKGKKGKTEEGGETDSDRDLRKVTNTIGGDEGKKIREAVESGALELTPRDVRDWAALSDATIKKVAPLVTGGSRLKPFKASQLLNSELSEKVVEDLHLRAIGNGGTFVHKAKGVTITVEHTGK